MHPSVKNKELVTLIIVSYNAAEDLDKCLRSIQQEKPPSLPVIVIDNNSPQKEVKEVLDYWQKKTGYKIVFNSQNIGFGRANNLAAEEARSEWLVLINNDVYWPAGELKKFLNFLSHQPKEVVAVGPKILSPNNNLQHSVGYLPNFFNFLTWAWGIDSFLGRLVSFYRPYHLVNNRAYKTQFKVEWLSGAVLAVRRKAFLQVGGFPRDIFMYGEDVILGRRLHQKGKLIFTPIAYFYHIGQASSHKEVSLYKEATFLIDFFNRQYSTLGRFYAKTVISLGFFLRSIVFTLLGRKKLGMSYWKMFRQLSSY